MVESGIAYAGLFSTHWISHKDLVVSFELFWLVFLVVVALLNWIIPTAAVRSLVEEIKTQRARELQTIITRLWSRLLEEGSKATDRTELKYFIELDKGLSQKQGWQVDIPSLIRFTGSVVIPAVIYLIQNKGKLAKFSSIISGAP
ncbi:MAG: hypothetical protein O7G87_06115 [bacterium]|nr:hypothetical protein [bacterium]